jgi:hypothetical protein
MLKNVEFLTSKVTSMRRTKTTSAARWKTAGLMKTDLGKFVPKDIPRKVQDTFKESQAMVAKGYTPRSNSDYRLVKVKITKGKQKGSFAYRWMSRKTGKMVKGGSWVKGPAVGFLSDREIIKHSPESVQRQINSRADANYHKDNVADFGGRAKFNAAGAKSDGQSFLGMVQEEVRKSRRKAGARHRQSLGH